MEQLSPYLIIYLLNLPTHSMLVIASVGFNIEQVIVDL